MLTKDSGISFLLFKYCLSVQFMLDAALGAGHAVVKHKSPSLNELLFE